jgi:hypothetical protein
MDKPESLSTAIGRYEKTANTSLDEIAIRATVAAIPYAGGSILELWSGLAQRRAHDRLHVVFSAMSERLEELNTEKVDRAFFDTPEFQNLLYLLLEKLHSTSDEEKLRMFGDALANSGNNEFNGTDKEECIRTLRELSAKDLKVLRDEKLKNWFPHTHTIEYAPPILSSLFRLVGMGLVLEKLNPKEPPIGRMGSRRLDSKQALEELLTQPPRRVFYLSPFGTEFLKFIGGDESVS